MVTDELKSALMDVLDPVRDELHEDIRSLKVAMLREFQEQRVLFVDALSQMQSRLDALQQSNESLRAEVEFLRYMSP